MPLRRTHLPGLDGLRALAVGSVIAYHLNLPFARGGYLGVDLFFVLSGFLITSLLLEERLETGRISLVAFWRRRARRLLPALYLMLVVVCLFPIVIGYLVGPEVTSSIALSSLRGYALSTFFYVTNWYIVGSGNSYFAHFAAPSALLHTWSLAIEEQFYLVWPLLTLVLVGKGIDRTRRRGLSITLALTVLSATLMAVLFNPADGSSANFVYNATHTRLFDLAAGASLAWWVVNRPARTKSHVLNVASVAALVGLIGFMVAAGDDDYEPFPWMFRGGLLFCAGLSTLVIAGLRDSSTLVARLFSLSPARYVGNISYGLYLWHWPAIVLITPALIRLGDKQLLLVRLITIAVATLASFYLLEKPIREGRWSLSRRRIVAVGGSVVTLAAIFSGTSASLVPRQSMEEVMVRYAPADPPAGTGHIIGLNELQPLPFAITRERPLRVASVGDSVPHLGRFGLRAAIESIPNTVFASEGRGGWGISGAPPWKSSMEEFLDRFHPDVLLVSTSWDNATALHLPDKFAADYRDFLAFVESRGVSVVAFVGSPLKHSAGYDFRPAATVAKANTDFKVGHEAWRRQVIKLVRANPGHTLFFPVDRIFEINGQFSDFLPPQRDSAAPRTTWDRVRMTDGTHFCPPGIVMWAAAISYDISIAFNTPPAPGEWWLGKWRDAKTNYGMGANMCPQDHPH